MTQSTSASPPALLLSEQVAETCMLQCYLMEALDSHDLDLEGNHGVEIQLVVARMMDVLHQHTLQLAVRLERRPPGHDEWVDVKSRHNARLVQARAQPHGRSLRAILLADSELLNLATMHYQMLRHTARSVGDEGIAALAAAHLKQLAALTEEIASVLPPERSMNAAALIVHGPTVVERHSVWQRNPSAA